MKLVPDWKEAWTWTSMHAFAGIGAVQGIWRALPDRVVAHLPSWTPLAATLLLVVIGVVGRLRDQGSKKRLAISKKIPQSVERPGATQC